VGIQLFGEAARGNVIEGNAIGLDAAGRPVLPNRAGGIFVNTGATFNQIGGTAPGEANRGQSRPLITISGFHQSRRATNVRATRRIPVVRTRPGFAARRLDRTH
jgi:hypothetical protein